MVVGVALAPLVYSSPQDGVGQRIAGALYFKAAEDKVVGKLGSHHGIQHDCQVAAGRVLHAYGHIAAAGYQPVKLVLHGTGAYRHIGHHV